MSSSIFYLVTIQLLISLQIFASNQPEIGCPDNSMCSSKLGESFSKWEQSWKRAKTLKQKNSVLKSIGLPISFYSMLGPDTGNQYASWHSKCVEHKKQNIFKSTGFLKDIKKSNDKMFQPISVKQRGKKWATYFVPLNFSLVETKNSRLIGFIENDDHFIPISIDKKGNIKILSKLPAQSFQTLQDQERTQCPIDIKELEPYKKYYLDQYCHYLKGGEKKSRLIALRYWSCP